MPEPGPLGETLFEANVRAMVAALFVNNPAGGWVESVVTFATHLRFGLLVLAILERLLDGWPTLAGLPGWGFRVICRLVFWRLVRHRRLFRTLIR
jgi:hypothetical protein